MNTEKSNNVVLSSRGKEIINHGGYLYCYSKSNHDQSIFFWRCDKLYLYDCKVILHTPTTDNAILKVINAHSRCYDCAEVMVATIRNKIKSRSSDSASYYPL